MSEDSAGHVGSAIRAVDVSKQFGTVHALRGVSFDVKPGEVYALLGRNGAGKSTLVRMICTLLLPTAGDLDVFGTSVRADPREVRRLIGVALQDATLDPTQTGRELLELHAALHGLRRAALRCAVDDAIVLAALGDGINRVVSTYSGGMRRRLDLAVALVHRPSLVVLDEPTTGLDPQSRSHMWDLIARLAADDGITVLLTTQYLEEADRLANRVGILHGGALIEEAAPKELKRLYGAETIELRLHKRLSKQRERHLRRHPSVRAVVVDEQRVVVEVTSGESFDVTRAILEMNAPVIELSLRPATLDDAFLHLTGTHV